jgi:hypothetical protein
MRYINSQNLILKTHALQIGADLSNFPNRIKSQGLQFARYAEVTDVTSSEFQLSGYMVEVKLSRYRHAGAKGERKYSSY